MTKKSNLCKIMALFFMLMLIVVSMSMGFAAADEQDGRTLLYDIDGVQCVYMHASYTGQEARYEQGDDGTIYVFRILPVESATEWTLRNLYVDIWFETGYNAVVDETVFEVEEHNFEHLCGRADLFNKTVPVSITDSAGNVVSEFLLCAGLQSGKVSISSSDPLRPGNILVYSGDDVTTVSTVAHGDNVQNPNVGEGDAWTFIQYSITTTEHVTDVDYANVHFKSTGMDTGAAYCGGHIIGQTSSGNLRDVHINLSIDGSALGVEYGDTTRKYAFYLREKDITVYMDIDTAEYDNYPGGKETIDTTAIRERLYNKHFITTQDATYHLKAYSLPNGGTAQDLLNMLNNSDNFVQWDTAGTYLQSINGLDSSAITDSGKVCGWVYSVASDKSTSTNWGSASMSGHVLKNNDVVYVYYTTNGMDESTWPQTIAHSPAE